jgi:hypothetical protein
VINEVIVIGSAQMRETASQTEYDRLRADMLAIVRSIPGLVVSRLVV